MAFDKKPSSWITGWSADGTDISFPIASLPGLTAADADGTTGDIRKVLFALMDSLLGVWYILDNADRPTQMTLAQNTSGGSDGQTLTQQYVAQFTTEVSEQDVADEPVVAS